MNVSHNRFSIHSFYTVYISIAFVTCQTEKQPEVIVRPAGWLDLETGSDLVEEEPEVPQEKTELEKWIAEMGLDINPWLLLVGAGGVVIFIVGILIAKSVKDFKDRQNLEKAQMDFMARGPQVRVYKVLTFVDNRLELQFYHLHSSVTSIRYHNYFWLLNWHLNQALSTGTV